MTAAEAAALIKNGDHIAMSGFTPAGVANWPMPRRFSIVLPTPPILISASM